MQKKAKKTFNYFNRINVWSTDFEEHELTWDFVSYGIYLFNESASATDIIEYSFNGADVHGDLVPGTETAGIEFYGRRHSKIYFRRKSGTGDISLRIEAWSA